MKSTVSFFSLSLLLAKFFRLWRKEIGKETAPRDRVCGPGPLRIPLRIGAFAHKKAQMLPPNQIFHNATPMDASVSAGWLLDVQPFREPITRTLTFCNGQVHPTAERHSPTNHPNREGIVGVSAAGSRRFLPQTKKGALEHSNKNPPLFHRVCLAGFTSPCR